MFFGSPAVITGSGAGLYSRIMTESPQNWCPASDEFAHMFVETSTTLRVLSAESSRCAQWEALRSGELRRLPRLLQAVGAPRRGVHVPRGRPLRRRPLAAQPVPVVPLPEVPPRPHEPRRYLHLNFNATPILTLWYKYCTRTGGAGTCSCTRRDGSHDLMFIAHSRTERAPEAARGARGPQEAPH